MVGFHLSWLLLRIPIVFYSIDRNLYEMNECIVDYLLRMDQDTYFQYLEIYELSHTRFQEASLHNNRIPWPPPACHSFSLGYQSTHSRIYPSSS